MIREKFNNKNVFLLLLIGLLIFGLLVVLSTNAMAQDVQNHSVILNHSNPTKELSMDELAQIYLGEKQRWDDGSKIKLAVLKPGADGADLISGKLVNMSAHEFSKYWLAMIFQGRVSAPQYFNTQESIVAFVNENTAAIGICDSKWGGENNILSIDGKKEF